jgi:hypothetical protein
MKKAIRNLGITLLLCAAVGVTGQAQLSNQANREQAKQMGANVERTVRVREPNWKSKGSYESKSGSHHYFKSANQEVDVSTFVYDSPEEASKQLRAHAKGSSLTAEQELKGIGDEAFYMSHKLFSWIGVRKGRMVVEVHGPGPELTVTKRFVRYGLEQIGK